MHYRKHYDLLIERARSRSAPDVTERHHIIPKCMGGSNDGDNLVLLTPEEHYLAHRLLVKIYPDNAKLHYAVHRMSFDGRSNKFYGWFRKRFLQFNSEQLSAAREKWLTHSTPDERSDAIKKSWNTSRRNKMSARVSALWETSEYREKQISFISKKAKERWSDPEYKERVSNSLRENGKNQRTCPHCGKTGGHGIARWHFDNCRNKS